MDHEFRDKVAIVTGGSTGIGRAVTERLAEAGSRVWILDRDTKAGTELVASLYGDRLTTHFIPTELGDAKSVHDAFEVIRNVEGGVDLLHSNAGIQRYGTVTETSEEMWDEVFRINVKSAYLVCHEAIPLMQKRGGGAVVLTSSVQAFATQKQVVAYSASKGALVTMATSMALDHARDGIRINCIAPGSVDTPMLRTSAALFSPDDPQRLIDRWAEGHPLGKIATPAEVAEVVTFLLSNGARFITGTTVRVDGGLLAQVGVPLP